MINSILTNMPALKMRNNFNTTSNKLSTSLERLSSGFKINCAKDDAANAIISARTDVQLSGLAIASKNAMQGTSMLNIADSALENMTDKIMRIRDLSLKTLNSTCSIEEKQAMQKEIDELCAEIRREKDTTIYNEKKIFDPSTEKITEIKPPEKPYAYEVEYLESTGAQFIDTGYSMASANLTVDMNIQADNIPATEAGILGNYEGNTSQNAIVVGFHQNKIFQYSKKTSPNTNVYNSNVTTTDKMHLYIEYDGDNDKKSLTINDKMVENTSYTIDSINPKSLWLFMGNKTLNKGIFKLYDCKIYDNDTLVRDYIPVIDNNGEACLYDKVTGQFFYNQGTGEFVTGNIIPPEESTFEKSIYDNSTTLQIGSKAGVNNSITYDLGFNLDKFDMNVSTTAGAKVAIQKCDELMNIFSDRRSKVGSIMSRIDSIINLQENDKVNLSSKNSIIKDTNIASEAANYTQSQILQQVSISLFSQANMFNGNLALRLLQT